MSIKVITLEDFDVTKLKIGPVRANGLNKGHSANLSYDGHKFLMAIMNVRFPFGVSLYKDTDTSEPNVKPKLSLMAELSEKQIGVIDNIDEHTLNHFNNNDSLRTMFDIKPKYFREVVESRHIKMLKYSIDKTTGRQDLMYPPRIRVKINRNRGTGELMSDFFVPEYQNIDGLERLTAIKKVEINDDDPSDLKHIIHFLPPNAHGSLLVSLRLALSKDSGFTIVLNLQQARVNSIPTIRKGICLIPNIEPLYSGAKKDEDLKTMGIACLTAVSKTDPICDDPDPSEKLSVDDHLCDDDEPESDIEQIQTTKPVTIEQHIDQIVNSLNKAHEHIIEKIKYTIDADWSLDQAVHLSIFLKIREDNSDYKYENVRQIKKHIYELFESHHIDRTPYPNFIPNDKPLPKKLMKIKL